MKEITSYSNEHSESIRVELNLTPKHIYLIQLIESESDRVLFATFDEEKANSYAEKANKMIDKWAKYWDSKLDDPFFDYNHAHAYGRLLNWYDARKVRVIKTTVR